MFVVVRQTSCSSGSLPEVKHLPHPLRPDTVAANNDSTSSINYHSKRRHFGLD